MHGLAGCVIRAASAQGRESCRRTQVGEEGDREEGEREEGECEKGRPAKGGRQESEEDGWSVQQAHREAQPQGRVETCYEEEIRCQTNCAKATLAKPRPTIIAATTATASAAIRTLRRSTSFGAAT